MSRADFRLVKNVAIEAIELDVDNARIRAGKDQADCIARILRKEDQMMVLMQSIAEEGLTTIPILVSPGTGARKKTWIVRDGNRRITALKLLNDPSMCPVERLRARIKDLAKKHKANVVASVDVLTSDNEEAIFKEVVARHSGAQGGAGQLDWSAYLRTVYYLRHQHPPEYKRAAQYCFWAEDQGLSVDDDFPITTVHRFFTVDNLSLLGFKVDRDELVLTVAAETAKAMAQRAITDFQLGREKGGKSVDDVRSPDQAKNYILGLRAAAGLPSPKSPALSPAPTPSPTRSPAPAPGPRPAPAAAPSPGGAATAPAPAPPPPAPSPSPRTPPTERNKLFGKAAPNIAVPESELKARTIVAELRILDVKKTPLAVAGLLRQLIELSDAHYRKKHHRGGDSDSLAKNIRASATRMRDSGDLDAGQFDIVNRLTDNSAPGLLQIEMLQKVMHRDTHHPSYQLLNGFWDNIGTFVRTCWVK
jgi:hypothetical protein